MAGSGTARAEDPPVSAPRRLNAAPEASARLPPIPDGESQALLLTFLTPFQSESESESETERERDR